LRKKEIEQKEEKIANLALKGSLIITMAGGSLWSGKDGSLSPGNDGSFLPVYTHKGVCQL